MASLSQKQIDRIEQKMEALAHKLASGGFGYAHSELLMRIGRYKELLDERNVWKQYRNKTETSVTSSMSELPDDEDEEPSGIEDEQAETPPRRLPRRPARGWGG